MRQRFGKRLGGLPAQRLVAVAGNVGVEPRRRGQPQPRARILAEERDEVADRARGNDDDILIVDDERQQAGGGRFDQAVVVQRASLARAVHQRLEHDPEVSRQLREVVVLVDVAGRHQDTVGGDADKARTLLRHGEHTGRQAAAQTVDFGGDGAGGAIDARVEPRRSAPGDRGARGFGPAYVLLGLDRPSNAVRHDKLPGLRRKPLMRPADSSISGPGASSRSPGTPCKHRLEPSDTTRDDDGGPFG